MLFNSFHFLLFFPATLVIYFLVPCKWRYLVLLLASYYFYMSWNVKYVLLLILSTLITYVGARFIDCRKKQGKKAGIILAVTILLNLAILFYFKYFNFLSQTLNRALQLFHVQGKLPIFDILLPVGISFYTFQALGYAIDVYRGDLISEKNILCYALFVSFFPQLVAGPIERACNLLPQIQNLEKITVWNSQRIQRGCFIMLYGFMMKMLIADRSAPIVNAVFNDYMSCSAGMCVFAIFLFTIQIYCDFAGYSYIALGAAKMMGIELMENFNSPFLAKDFREFWKRWHISLSSWFMDYLYIPLGGNRKGKLRKYANLMVVFLVSGLWHGAAWHFVAWGALHAVYRIVGDITSAARNRLLKACGIEDNNPLLCAGKTLITFSLTCFAFLFFRTGRIMQGIDMTKKVMTQSWNIRDVVRNLPIRWEEVLLLMILIFILFLIEFMKEKGAHFIIWLERRHWFFRTFFLLCGFFVILLFGVYGPKYDASTFIYFQF